MAAPTATPTRRSEIRAVARLRYEALGITQEMERAVIEHLSELGAMTNCFTPGSTDCTAPCPQGQHCTKSTKNNCICVNDK